MGKFYCNNCNEEVILKNGRCPKCNTNWEKIIDDSQKEEAKPFNMTSNENNNYDYEEQSSYVKTIKVEDIKENINFFLSWSSIIKYSSFVIGIICFIFGIIYLIQENSSSLQLLLIGIVLLILGSVFENMMKWKAYMLHTNLKKR